MAIFKVSMPTAEGTQSVECTAWGPHGNMGLVVLDGSGNRRIAGVVIRPAEALQFAIGMKAAAEAMILAGAK